MLNTLLLAYIPWGPDPVFCHIGSLSVRYYSLLWVVGLGFGYFIARREYRDRGLRDELYEPLFLSCFLGVLIGARLGHCLFYEPAYYLHHLREMILPIKVLPNGGWQFTGYQGLASHGGALGMIVAFWIYCRRTKMHYMDVLDVVGVATPMTACCIRLANLMNSEILGHATDVPWAFIFTRVDNVPRHPAQLYEALAYFIFFLGMVWLYRRSERRIGPRVAPAPATDRHGRKLPPQTDSTGHLVIPRPMLYHRGFFFGLCLTEVFIFRFLIEFLKEDQVDFEANMSLNMGQWLSIPFILVGLYCMLFYGRRGKGTRQTA